MRTDLAQGAPSAIIRKHAVVRTATSDANHELVRQRTTTSTFVVNGIDEDVIGSEVPT